MTKESGTTAAILSPTACGRSVEATVARELIARKLFRGRRRIGLAATLVLILGTGATVLIVALARANVRDTERSLLRERSGQTLGVVATVVQQLEAIVAGGAAAANYSDGDPRAFDDATGARVRASLLSSLSLLRLGPAGPRLVASVGRSEPMLFDPRDRAATGKLRAIARSGAGLTLVRSATRGGLRVVAFGASPRRGSDLILFGELTAADAQGQAGGVEAGDLSFAIYLGRRPTRDALLLASPGGGPTGADVVADVLRIGEEELLVTLAPRGSLVGDLTRSAPWIMLGLGLVGSAVLAGLVETARRRRDEALRLVGDLGRRTAELDRALAEQQRAQLDARSSAEKLAAAEETYRTLVERLPLVTYVDTLDSSLSPAYVSPQIEGLLGYSVDDWLADPELFAELLHPDDREHVLAGLARWRSGELDLEPPTEFRLVTRDGRVVWVYADAAYVRDAEGRPLSIQGFLVDITERKRLEEELRQAQRLEAVGRVAGGIAHDFNNLLTVIFGWARFLLQGLASDDVKHEGAEQILDASKRAAALTQQLLAFSRRQVLRPQPLDLNRVVRDMERLLERVIGEDILLVTELDPALGTVKADQGQLEQVILNLAVNARDAMPAGGRLTIATGTVEHMAAEPRDEAESPSGPYVTLTVSDTGHGMDEETRVHAFEPFFTTKETGRGTGLGLATVYGIVLQSGGVISVDSDPGQGATFTIQLPQASEEERIAVEVDGPDADWVGGSESILLVEDDRAVRDTVCKILAEHGYAVLVADSPADAIATANVRERRFDLLLTDVVMPKMSGPELSDALLAAQPGMRTLFMSGYTDEAIAHHGVLEDGISFIGKPFTPESLVRKVREVLGVHAPDATAHGWERGW